MKKSKTNRKSVQGFPCLLTERWTIFKLLAVPDLENYDKHLQVFFFSLHQYYYVFYQQHILRKHMLCGGSGK